MSPSSSHGRGRDQEPARPLRRATRAESTRARRQRRGWRARKIGVIFASMPVVVVAFVGLAMASPFRHHHDQGGGQNTGAAACANPAMGSSSATASMNSTSNSSPGSVSGAGYHYGNYYNHHHGHASASASASAMPSGSATATSTGMTGTVTTTPSSTSSAIACQNTMTAAAGTASATTMTSATSSAAATASASAAAPAPPAAATPNPNCTLVVPPNPLSAQGLATPYQLTATNAAMGPCHEANANQSAFVQAAVYNPATGAISIYEPLVIDMGTQPAAPTVTPTLPANAIVGIWFGFNATNLTLQDSNGSLNAGKCVNGLGNGDVFGQFAYCNAPAFFNAVNAGIQGGMVTVPNPGTATDGQPCLTLRDFALIDQDQSDNVPSAYLANANGQTAQKNAANTAALAGATTIANPSDNGLLDNFVDPALGCTPWTAPDLSNNNTPAPALPLDELQAAAFQKNPAALVPLNDPMTLANNAMSNQKDNLYRAGVDQPQLPAGQTPAQYCGDMDSIQSTRLQQDVNLLINKTTPAAGAASNLFTFLGMRLQQSFGNLNCKNFGLTNPVNTLGMDGNGVVVSVVFAQTTNAITAGAGNPAQKCVNMNGAAAQTACALAAVGMPTNPAQSSAAPSPMPTQTPTAVPSGNMRHNTHTHWRW